MERFVCKTMIVSGEEALGALEDYTGKRLLMVTDRMQISESMTGWIMEMLKPESADCFDSVTPEPDIAQAVEGANRIKAFCPELVVALGGTHVVDCAKAIAERDPDLSDEKNVLLRRAVGELFKGDIHA